MQITSVIKQTQRSGVLISICDLALRIGYQQSGCIPVLFPVRHTNANESEYWIYWYQAASITVPPKSLLMSYQSTYAFCPHWYVLESKNLTLE